MIDIHTNQVTDLPPAARPLKGVTNFR